ncbi:MAG: ATPase, T2SS/T4P/T4SS family [Clostridia bacterium]
MFTGLKDQAALGNRTARQNIVDYYIRLLESYEETKLESMIRAAVDFEDIGKNSVDVVFELLLANFTFEQILQEYTIHSRDIGVMEETFLRLTARELEGKVPFLRRYEKKRERLSFICVLLYAVSYGQSCIEALQYMDINEIGILNKNYIYIIYKGIKIRLKFLAFENTGTIINIQKKTTQKAALNYDMQNPIIVTSKNNSNRISAAGYDVTPGDDDFYYNERLFNLTVVSLEDIAEKYQTIDQTMISFLKYNQKGRGSFIVSGSDMGIGKSTFLLSMIGEYPNYWGIGILDQQNELQAGIKYPEKNVITLVENMKRDLAQSFAYLLKTSRDILVVSEITLPEEVSELVNAALRLNAGVSATMHSFSPKEVIPNLRNLMMKTPMYHDKNTAEEDIAVCIDLNIN